MVSTLAWERRPCCWGSVPLWAAAWRSSARAWPTDSAAIAPEALGGVGAGPVAVQPRAQRQRLLRASRPPRGTGWARRAAPAAPGRAARPRRAGRAARGLSGVCRRSGPGRSALGGGPVGARSRLGRRLVRRGRRSRRRASGSRPASTSRRRRHRPGGCRATKPVSGRGAESPARPGFAGVGAPAVAAGVEAQPGDVEEDVAGVGVDGHPAARARVRRST